MLKFKKVRIKLIKPNHDGVEKTVTVNLNDIYRQKAIFQIFEDIPTIDAYRKMHKLSMVYLTANRIALSLKNKIASDVWDDKLTITEEDLNTILDSNKESISNLKKKIGNYIGDFTVGLYKDALDKFITPDKDKCILVIATLKEGKYDIEIHLPNENGETVII